MGFALTILAPYQLTKAWLQLSLQLATFPLVVLGVFDAPLKEFP